MSIIATPSIIRSVDDSTTSDLRVWSSLKTIEEIEKRRNNNFRIWKGDIQIVCHNNQSSRTINAINTTDMNFVNNGGDAVQTTTQFYDNDADFTTNIATGDAKYIRLQFTHNTALPGDTGSKYIGIPVIQKAYVTDGSVNYDVNIYVHSCAVHADKTVVVLGIYDTDDLFNSSDPTISYTVNMMIRSERFVV